MSASAKFSTDGNDVFSLSLYWPMLFSDAPVPSDEQLDIFLRVGSLPSVMDILAKASRRGNFDDDLHLYKWITASLRNQNERARRCTENHKFQRMNNV